MREFTLSVISGPVIGDHGPAEPTTVTFEVSGRHAEEFTAMIYQRS
ncbi:hypothetical protein [Nocardia rhamnosiphila]|nr:hypothetical protein [Nocardia rhamnosiphila]